MLTAQKRKFALALISGMSKKDAAIKAGYSANSARSKGSQLAKDPEVIAFMSRKKNEKAEVDDVPTHGKKVNTPAINTPLNPDPEPVPEIVRAAGEYDDPLEFLKSVNRAGILEAKKVAADAESSVAQLETDVVAQFAQQQAAIQEKMTAYTDANGGSAIYTLKAGVKYGGANYDAGMSVAVTINGSEVTTRFAVNANQFVVASGSGNNVYSPFIIKDGQALISQAFIGEGWITNAMIGNYIQSNNYVAGATGWMLSKSGIFENNGYEPGNGRMVQTNNQISVYDGNGVLRVRMGKLS